VVVVVVVLVVVAVVVAAAATVVVVTLGGVALWHRGRVSDLQPEAVGSSFGRALRRKNSGQVFHTYVPQSPSSVTWYRRKLGSKQTCRAIH